MREDVLIADVVPDEVVAALRADFTVYPLWLINDRSKFFASIGRQIRGLVTTWQMGFSAALISKLPTLQVISVYGTGDQSLDLEAARSRGIVVMNTAIDGTDACVAEMAMTFALVLGRRVIEADRFVRDGSWLDAPFPATNHFGGKCAGIVGLGFIGRQIAKRAEAFAMTIAYHDVMPLTDVPYQFYPDLNQLAEDSDVLFVSCRGGPEANGMINARILDSLGPRGYLVHIAQARFYDEEALLLALRGRKIAGAAIDIFPNEPKVNPEFLTLDNVILSPHVGAITHEVLARRAELAVNNLKMFFSGGSLTSRVV